MKAKLVLSLLAIASGMFAQSTNLVRNGDFEELDASGYPVGWSKHPDVWSSSTENVFHGSRSFLYDNKVKGNYKFVSQNLKAEEGKMYEFSIKAKMVIYDESAAKGATPNIFMEAYGDKGTYMGGNYVDVHTSLNTDWDKYTGHYQVPAGAKKVNVGFRARKDGVNGVKIWFDECEVHELTAKPLSGILTTNSYRDQAAGGEVTVLCGRGYGKSNVSDKTYFDTPLLLKDSSGKQVLSVPVKELLSDRIVFSFNSDKLPTGKYMMEYSIKDPATNMDCIAKHAFTKLAKAPEYKCYVDEHHRMILDGKPFFPLGMYFSSIDKDDIAPYLDSKFNCVIPYASPKDKATLDFLQEHNLKVFYSIKDFVSARGDAKATLEKQKKGLDMLKAVKDHPAIAAWYINDELKEEFLNDAIQYRQACEELDPSRPTWTVLCTPSDFHAFTTSSDIHGSDPYPIPEGDTARAYRYTIDHNNALLGSKMLIQVPQTFCWGRYWVKYGYPMEKCNACRRPTFEEMDTMSWLCIAGGANGLIYYSYFDMRLRDKPMGELKRIPFDEHFADCKKVAERIMRHEKVLLSTGTPAKYSVKENAENNTVFRAYGHEGSTWILAINKSHLKETSFSIETEQPMKLHSVSLANVSVEAKEKTFSATLKPMEAVFLQLK